MERVRVIKIQEYYVSFYRPDHPCRAFWRQLLRRPRESETTQSSPAGHCSPPYIYIYGGLRLVAEVGTGGESGREIEGFQVYIGVRLRGIISKIFSRVFFFFCNPRPSAQSVSREVTSLLLWSKLPELPRQARRFGDGGGGALNTGRERKAWPCRHRWRGGRHPSAQGCFRRARRSTMQKSRRMCVCLCCV